MHLRHPALLLLLFVTAACDPGAASEEALDAAPRDTALPDTSDTSSPAATCALDITTQDGDATRCLIDPATMLGCEALAACLCNASDVPPEQLEGCIDSMIIPRGAITLADYCILSGSPNPQSLASLAGQPWDMRPEPAQIAFDGCQDIPAFTLWGESPQLFLSISTPGASLPSQGTPLSDYSLEQPPVADSEAIASLHLATSTLTLAQPDAIEATLANALSEPRYFVIHDTDSVYLAGRFVSRAQSASVEEPVVLIEDLVESGYATLRIDDGYPSAGPLEATRFGWSWIAASFASERKMLDAGCLADASCPEGRTCVEMRCQ